MSRNLRITPQRLAVLEAVTRLSNHPTAEGIIDFIQKNHPNIATGTVYKILDVLIDSGLVTRVKTDSDSMRYDAVMEHHHHLYCEDSDRIEDFADEELDILINNYLNGRRIPGFEITDVTLQIRGKFIRENQSLTP